MQLRSAGSIVDYAVAMLSVAAVTALTLSFRVQLGLAAIALLFLLPVLLGASRGGIRPGLVAAGGSALAYNFFMLPPRFTLSVHGYDNIVSLIVLFAVAIVTSRLAERLKHREAAALAVAEANAEAVAFGEVLAGKTGIEALDRAALAFVEQRFGAAHVLVASEIERNDPGMPSLDHAAATWTQSNGEATGHGTSVMGAAEWSFVPMEPRAQGDMIAIARPEDGTIRPLGELTRLQGLAEALGRARNRAALSGERGERQRLEELDALRQTLLESIGHDFRTPLTVIKGGIEGIEHGDANAARVLLDEVHRLERMIGDLLGLARIDADAVGVAQEPVDLVDIVRDVIDRGHVVPPGVAIETDVASDLPLVDADPVLLRHMLLNLVDNAVRHGGECIRVQAVGGDGWVTLSVADDGPGIADGQEVAIFDRFKQLAVGDRVGGTGLGLAIVAGFARAMGAKVTAANGDIGAVLSIQLPIHRSGIQP